MQLPPLLNRIKQYDESRPSLPGEHWLVLGAGVLLLAWAVRRRSLSAGTTALGLLARAASGRDGLRRVGQR